MNTSHDLWSTWDALLSGTGSRDAAECLAEDVDVYINGVVCGASRDECLDLQAAFLDEYPDIDIAVVRDIRTELYRAIEWTVVEDSIGGDAEGIVFGVSIFAAKNSAIKIIRHIFSNDRLERGVDGVLTRNRSSAKPVRLRAAGQ